MADFIKGLAEVKHNEISLLFLIDGFEKIMTSMRSWDSQERFSLKPCWSSYNIFSLDRCFVIEDATMCSRVLQRIQVKNMGM